MAAAHAAPITGTPVGNDFGWAPNSTNALNFAEAVPGREGQVAPYVLFVSNTTGSVVLDFFNFASAGIAFFEIRIDGNAAGTNPHPVVTGDTIHPGVFVGNQASELNREFLASSFVDVRLALGGERDWDFDWVRFDVAKVPEPSAFVLVAFGLLGLLLGRRRLTS
ncbi:MAG: PEP-CTERM sorting domain-containing protein [Gammaproteobacteria bacterium]|nr:PEP-CTERM sorting domain-containing protein [Gammaproteobacteria bacterium]